MYGPFEVSDANQHAYMSWSFLIHILLLIIFCKTGEAGIVVYDDGFDIEEFPDRELSYTQSIRRNGIEGVLVAANPLNACSNISRPPDMNGSLNWFVLMSGSACTFETKVLNAKLAGYSLGIIYSYRGRVPTSSNLGRHRFYSDMPAVVVKTEHGIRLKDNYLFDNDLRYRLVVFPNNSFSIMTFLLLFSIVAGLFLVIMLAFTVIRFFQQSNVVTNGRLTSQHLRQLQTTTFQKGDLYETCAICLEDYKDQDKLRILPCSHGYHMKCIDPWLINNRCICPVCKRKVLAGESSNNTSQNVGDTETTPLLQGNRSDTHGACNYLNAPASVNPNPNDLAFGNTTAGNARSMSDPVIHAERHHDE